MWGIIMLFLRLLTVSIFLLNSMSIFAAEDGDRIKNDPLKEVFDQFYTVGRKIRDTPLSSYSTSKNVSDDERAINKLYDQLYETDNDYMQKADKLLSIFNINIEDIKKRMGNPNLKRAELSVKSDNQYKASSSGSPYASYSAGQTPYLTDKRSSDLSAISSSSRSGLSLLRPGIDAKQKVEPQESPRMNRFNAAFDYYVKNKSNVSSVRGAYNGLQTLEKAQAKKMMEAKDVNPSVFGVK